MPFGIKSAPEVFQKKNESIFGDIDGVDVIFDDIIFAGAHEQEHDQIMVKLLQRAREANVKFNTAKLQYKVSEVKHMGNIVSESGLKLDGEKVCAIIQMPSPQSKDVAEILRNGQLLLPVYSQTVGNYCTIATTHKERSSMDLVARAPTVSGTSQRNPV